MRVALHGAPPTHIRETLSDAGLIISPDGAAVHLAWPDGAGCEALAALNKADQVALAIIEDDSQLLDAVLAGAAGVVSGTDPQRLRVELECHLRLRVRLLGQAVDPQVQHLAALGQQVVRASPDPIVGADLRGKVALFSPAAAHALGYSTTYATTQLHVTDIYANPTDARRVLSELRLSEDGVLRDFPVRLRARSGEHIPVLLSATEVAAASDEAVATVGIFRDQRVEHGLRRRLQDATAQLIRSEQRANAVSAAKAAAHELNQPLTALMGALELIDLREDLPEDIRRRLDRMYGQLDRMAEIVRGLGQRALSDSAGE